MKRNIIFLIVGLVALLAFQAKVVMPFVYDMAASDLFLKDTGDEANRTSANTQMTIAAFNQCNTYIANDILPEQTVTFSDKAINAFSLGGFRYVINSDIEIQPKDSTPLLKRYVCRIAYTSDDNDDANILDPDNWSVDGISGLDESNVL